MRQRIALEVNQVPAALRGAYNGRKFEAVLTDSVHLTQTYWSGGSRSTYRAVRLADGRAESLPGNPNPPQFGGNMEGQTIPLSPGFAIIEHSIFMGKDMGLTFYIHPDNAGKFLPEPDGVDKFERIVLAATRTYKASYGGVKNLRFVEAHKCTKITAEDYEAAKARLIARKLLNKAGAITAKGKNAIGDYDLPYRGDIYNGKEG